MTLNSLLASTAITLVQNDLLPFLFDNRALLFGYLSQRKNQSFVKDFYFAYHKKIEEEWNQKHSLKLHQVFRETGNYRKVLQAEDACLHEEMRALAPRVYYGRMKLKIDDLTYTQNRFLELFFHRNNIADDKRAELIKEIDIATDYTFFVENLTEEGVSGFKTGRTILEPFAETLSSFMTRRADEIFPENTDLSKQLDRLKTLDTTQRDILIMKLFADTLSDIMHVAKSLQLIQKLAFPEKIVDKAPIQILGTELVQDQFPKWKDRFISILDTDIPCQLPQSVLDETETIAYSFFTKEVVKLRDSLSNFCVMLKVSLEVDFSEAIRASAQKAQAAKARSWKGIMSPKSPSHSRSPSDVDQSRVSSLPSPSSVSAQTRPPTRAHSTSSASPLTSLVQSFRKALSLSSDETSAAKEEEKIDRFTRIEAYYHTFSVTLQVLDKIVAVNTRQVPEKRSPGRQ